MALIFCPECNKEISDKAESCPHCGYPIKLKQYEINNSNFNNLTKSDMNSKTTVKRKVIKFMLVSSIILISIIALYLFVKDKADFNSIGDEVAISAPNIQDDPNINTLDLPENITDDEKEIITSLQGKWKSQYGDDTTVYIFNGMQVQSCYKIETNGYESYISDLEFIEKYGSEYLVEVSDSHPKNIYCIFTNHITIGSYDERKKVPYQIEYGNESYTKIDDSNTFLVKPQIGMTKQEVENSLWGLPEDVNITTTAYSVSEQWVYDDYKYVYFEDGNVTSIQE